MAFRTKESTKLDPLTTTTISMKVSDKHLLDRDEFVHGVHETLRCRRVIIASSFVDFELWTNMCTERIHFESIICMRVSLGLFESRSLRGSFLQHK
jgi:hypothetical protein